MGPDLVDDGDLPEDLRILGIAEAEVLEEPAGDPDEPLLQVEVGLAHGLADRLAVLLRQLRGLLLDLLDGQPEIGPEGAGFAGQFRVVGAELEELGVDADHPFPVAQPAQLVEDGPVHDLELLDLLVRPVDQGQLFEGGQMGLLALQDEAEQPDGLFLAVLFDQIVDEGLEQLVGLVELVLEDLDPPQLDPGVDVERMAGDDAGEDLLRLLGVAGLEVDVAEDVEELDVVGRAGQLLLQQLDGPPGLALLLVDVDQTDDAARVARPQGQGLGEHGRGGVELALLEVDLGALVELVQGGFGVAGLPVEAGQGMARLVVLAVELDDLVEDGDGLGGLPAAGQPARDRRVDGLGVAGKALLSVEVAELEGRIRAVGAELVDLLADGQGLGEQPPLLVLLGDLLEGADGPVALSDADVEVADDVEGPDVLGVAERELLVFGDGVADPAGPDELLGLFDDPDPVAARAHAVPPQPSLKEVRCRPVGPFSLNARRCSSVP